MFWFILDEDEDVCLTPLQRIFGEPTFLAYELSKNLPPRPEPSNSRKSSVSKVKSSHPAKLAGLFAAMDLTLSAGAVSPVISHALHSRDKGGKEKLNKNTRTRSVSLDSAQDAIAKLANSISAFKPGVVGASILLPAFASIPHVQPDSGQATQSQSSYLSSSCGEAEIRAGDSRSTETLTKDTVITKKTVKINESSQLVKTDQCDGFSLHSRSFSQSSTSSSVVNISGITSMGDPIRLGYMQISTQIDGSDQMVYCTKAPKPRLNHNSSISESKSVSAATGLYRTIVGELPAVLTVHDDSENESLKQSRELISKIESESENSVNICSSDDVTITGSPPREKEESASDISDSRYHGTLATELISRLLEEDSKCDNGKEFKETKRQFTCQSRGNPSMLRTSSKIRRQKRLDADFCNDTEDDVVVAQVGDKKAHDTVRKTKSDIGNVQILKNRRMQIPVRFAKSFDSKQDLDLHREDRQSEFASTTKPDLVQSRLTSGLNDGGRMTAPVLKDNNNYIKVNCHDTENVLHDDYEVKGYPVNDGSWYTVQGMQISSTDDVSGSKEDSSQDFPPPGEEESLEKCRSGNEQSRMRRRRLSQMSKKEVCHLIVFLF